MIPVLFPHLTVGTGVTGQNLATVAVKDCAPSPPVERLPPEHLRDEERQLQ